MAQISGSLAFNISSYIPSLVSGDLLSFEFISEYQPSNDWTASISYGGLTVDIEPQVIGGYPFATSSVDYGNFVYTTISPNVIVLNTNISSFYQNYIQVPSFSSGSGEFEVQITGSLYTQYGDVNYAFNPEFGDKIYIKSTDGRVQVVTVLSCEKINGRLNIYVDPSLINTFIVSPENISIFLITKKINDEQNVILSYAKPPGNTSYGFIIPEDVKLEVLQNISTIQSNVQNQLLSNQQNTN